MDTVSYLTINDETKEIADKVSRNNIENIAATIAAHSDDIEYIQLETGPSGSLANSINQAYSTAFAAQANAAAAAEAAAIADEKAVSASQSAAAAQNSADSAAVAASTAWDRAVAADEAAAVAESKADSATSAAAAAWSQADSAASAATEAWEKADDAGRAAASAEDKAVRASVAAAEAKESARDSNTFANGALAGLSTLESVIDTVEWFANHKTLSTDTEVNPEKKYYIYNSSAGTLSQVEPQGTENPAEEGWYEINETIQNYVASRVATTNDGLYVSTTSATSGWRILISTGTGNYTPGIFLVDPYGVVKQGLTGNGITFDSTSAFYLGDSTNEDTPYFVFDGRNSRIDIGGKGVNIHSGVTIGQDNKSLSEVLNDLGKAITAVEYGLSSSPDNYDDVEDWSSDSPIQESGKYVWMRTTTSDQTYTYTCIQGAQGEKGEKGDPGEIGPEGIGIIYTEVSYAVSDSGDIVPGDDAWKTSLNQIYEIPEYETVEDESEIVEGEPSEEPTEDNPEESSEEEEPEQEFTEEDLLTLPKGSWLWIRTVTTYSDSSSDVTYQKSYIGTDGQDGTSVYIESTSRDENTKTTTVTLIDGNNNRTTLAIADGQDGANGQQGPNGKNIHIAWADMVTIENGAVNVEGFSTSNSTNKRYMGVYDSVELADSEHPEDYNWSLIKGADGTSVTITDIKYAKSTTDTQPANDNFNSTMPQTTKGEWLWVKTTYSDGNVAVTKSYIGTDGEDGKSVSIGSINKEGGVTTVTLIDSDGNPRPPIEIADGKDGSNGQQGPAGVDGKPSYTHFAWANKIVINKHDSTNQEDWTIESENSGFSTSISAGKNYLGVYTDDKVQDSEDINDYSWTLVKGENGYSVVRILLYKRAASEPTPPQVSLTYNFSNNTLTGDLNGWSIDMPSGSDPCWVIAATATGIDTSDAITKDEWTTPTKVLENGAAGLNQATITLYQRIENQPAKPENSLTYTFATGALSGSLGNWKKTIPAANGLPCWITTAVAISSEATDTILSTEWSTPVRFVVDGEDGKILNILPGVYALSELPPINTVQDADSYLVDDGDGRYDLYYKGSRATEWTIVENWQGVEGPQGPQGKQGIQGPQGERGPQGDSITNIINYYLATNLSEGVTTSTTGWSTDIGSQTMTSTNKFLWNYEVIKNSKNQTINTTTPGIIGVYGEDGNDGRGITSIIEYYARNNSNVAPADNQFSTDIIAPNTDNKYLWNYEIINYTTGNPTKTDKHIVGVYGDKGDKGDTGVSISNITNYYLATNVSSGVTTSTNGWTTNIQTMTAEKQYLWNYEVTKGSDNSTLNTTTPVIIGRYGQNGSKGDPGKGISGITEHYQVSSSNSTAPVTWSDDVVSTTPTNKYLWNYETISYTDGTTEDTKKRVIGTHGEKGEAGTGVTVTSNVTQYTSSTSGTTTPTSGWQTSIPTVAQGSYLWTKVTTTFSDNSEAVSYTASRQGANGSSITVKSTEYSYQLSTSGTTPPTGTWQSDPQAPTTTQYAWTKTVVTYSDNSKSTTYTVGGKTGTNGSSSYTHIRYGTSSSGAGMTATPTASTTYIGIYIGTSATAPTTATSYTWSKFVGAKGDTGPEAVVTVTPSNINWDNNNGNGSATLTATLRVNGAITTPTGYNWTKGTDTTSLGTERTLVVDDLNATYNCTVTW